MGYPKFNNVQKVDGGAMSFTAYLRQIRLLYPNLPEQYEHFLKLIYDFNAEQLERLLGIPENDIAAEIVLATAHAMSLAKAENVAAFESFVVAYNLKDIFAELLGIEKGEGGVKQLKVAEFNKTDDFTLQFLNDYGDLTFRHGLVTPICYIDMSPADIAQGVASISFQLLEIGRAHV